MSQDARARTDLEQALERLHADSYGWALACCGHDAQDAGDVLQTAYVKVLSGAIRFGGRSTFRTWLFGVIRLTSLEQQRKSAQQSRVASVAPNLIAASDTSPADDAELAERCQRLLHALDTLAPRQREVLHLVFYHDLSIAEAATVMGISIGSARQHYTRGKTRLTTSLLQQLHEDMHAR